MVRRLPCFSSFSFLLKERVGKNLVCIFSFFVCYLAFVTNVFQVYVRFCTCKGVAARIKHIFVNDFQSSPSFPHTINSDWNSSRYMRSFSPCPLVNVSYRPPCANVRNAAIERPFYFIHTFSAFSSPIMYVFRCKALVVSIRVCKVCS